MNLTANSTLTVSSPDINGDGTYVSNLDCTWTIITPDNNHVINLQFNNFALDSQATCPDYVVVRYRVSLS